MMIFRTGVRGLKSNRAAFSFFEVMVTVSILSLGLVMIYRAFFTTMDSARHIQNRLYAVNLLDNYIARAQQDMKYETRVSFSPPSDDESARTGLTAQFDMKDNIQGIDDLDLYQLDIFLSWMEGQRTIRLRSSAYIEG